jgi:hypothetical protein
MEPAKWFSNWGQAIQTILAGVSCIFAGHNAWPDMKSNHLTLGAVLFVLLVALVIVSGFALTFAVLKVRKPKLTPIEKRVAEKARAELATLTWAQRVGVRVVYSRPGLFVGKLRKDLEDLGFASPFESIIQPILKTSLVTEDSSNINPSQFPAVADIVENAALDLG